MHYIQSGYDWRIGDARDQLRHCRAGWHRVHSWTDELTLLHTGADLLGDLAVARGDAQVDVQQLPQAQVALSGTAAYPGITGCFSEAQLQCQRLLG